MSATIPITLQAIPVPVTINATTVDQLLTVICRYVSGAIQQDVSFFQTVAADPTQLTTAIIFNTSQNVFKSWNSESGSYQAISQYQAGDVKDTFVSGDVAQLGWIQLNGRLISTIEGISQNQLSILNALYPSGSLPTVAPANLSSLPSSSAFNNIPITDIQPPANQIGNLPFGSSYDPAQPQALASNTEVLRTSTAALKTTVGAMKALSNTLVTALNGTTATPLYAQVFCGYP